mmetsp:Transcript_45182/g.118593  ORF Transcript_45182/g.118593 Transcript_45182/m.118593 type:complete len:106 (-) Transcript_45182:928-1245(-)
MGSAQCLICTLIRQPQRAELFITLGLMLVEGRHAACMTAPIRSAVRWERRAGTQGITPSPCPLKDELLRTFEHSRFVESSLAVRNFGLELYSGRNWFRRGLRRAR